MEKVLLVDGNSMLFRAFYATIYGRPMTTSNGTFTNAIYGFMLMFQKTLDLIDPQYVFVAFDAGKHTFRHELFKEYKGTRKPAPPELVPQFQMVRDLLDNYNVKWLEMVDIEADDLIGSFVNTYKDYDINILSSDRDLLQLINEHSKVWLMKKGISDIAMMDLAALKEESGIEPYQVIELKALMGDTADNIPGVSGIGEKTALKLLDTYQNIDNLYANIDQLKGKQKEKLVNDKEKAYLSKQLATINVDVKLPFSIDECLFKPNYKTLCNYLETLEMYSLSKKYLPLINENIIEKEHKEFSISDDIVLNSDIYALYFDCSLEHYMHAKIEHVGLSDGDNSYYVTFEQFVELLPQLQNKKLIGYDIKNDYHLLANHDLILDFDYDVMVMAFLVNSVDNSWEKVVDSYNLSEEYTFKDVYGSLERPKLKDEQMARVFSAKRAYNYFKIYQECKDVIVKDEMEYLFNDIEMPLTKTLFKMERNGICVSKEVLEEIANDCKLKIDELSASIYKHANQEFNINSPKQLGNILFDELGLPTGKKRSTSIDVLEKLVGVHPIIDDLMQYRKWQKIYSTYAQGLIKYIDEDGKIHTSFNQCISETGRLSSSAPNLQNISVRDEEGRMIRKAFFPSANHVLISSDYSQIELRMLAHMADEEKLIDAFNQGMDIHTKTAMDVFNVSMDEVDSHMRRSAKAVNFGIVYGISDFGLASQLNISRKDAKLYIDNYLASYPNIQKYMHDIVEQCKEDGYVSTLFKRRRQIPEINSSSYMTREFGKRAAMNAPIQGSAADLIKLAMINIDKKMMDMKVKSKMILQVHDELIFDVCDDEIDLMKNIIREGMEQAMDLKVKLKADCNIGKSWYEAK